MKKLILVFISAIIFTASGVYVEARDFYPKRMSYLNDWGVGVYFVPKEITVYSQPDEKSEILEYIKWDELGIETGNKNLSSQDVFLAFLPEKNIVLMNVVDESDDWCEIVYSLRENKKGWVKKSSSGKFLSWYSFMNKYGKANGLYIFHDIPESYKKLRTSPTDDARFQKDFGYIPDESKLSFIKGNWALVKFLNFDNSQNIGWTKWRNEEGKLFAFPLLDSN